MHRAFSEFKLEAPSVWDTVSLRLAMLQNISVGCAPVSFPLLLVVLAMQCNAMHW